MDYQKAWVELEARLKAAANQKLSRLCLTNDERTSSQHGTILSIQMMMEDIEETQLMETDHD